MTIQDHPEIHTVMLRLDNDPVGREGAEHIKSLLEPKGYTIADNPPVLAKDCNGELQFLQKHQHRSHPPKQAAAITREEVFSCQVSAYKWRTRS